jgi:hypothetical protein
MRRRLLFGLMLVAMMVVALPATAGDKTSVGGTYQYGFFYGTFDETDNTALFTGGPIESFCGDDPGALAMRESEKNDGSIHLKARGSGQPIYLYETDANDIPTWLYGPGGLCEQLAGGGEAPEPFAEGRAMVRVHDVIRSDGIVEAFNATSGWASDTDGTRYRVRASAELEIGPGGPIGDPRDFVSFDLKVFRH